MNELGKIGPQWDMDWCWGNRNMYGIDTNFPENWHTTMEYFANEQYYQTQQYNRLLIHDPFFLARVYEKYHQIRPTLIEEMIREGGSIDAYAAYLKESAKKNDERWKATYQEYRGLTFTLAVNQMKNFVVKRVKWLDEQFADFDTFVDSLGGYQRSRFVLMEEPLWEADGSVVIRANVSNGAKAVRFWLNGVLSQDSAVQEGVAKARFEAAHLDPEHVNIVVAMEMDDAGNYIYDGQASIEGDYHIVMGNYVLLEK